MYKQHTLQTANKQLQKLLTFTKALWHHSRVLSKINLLNKLPTNLNLADLLLGGELFNKTYRARSPMMF